MARLVSKWIDLLIDLPSLFAGSGKTHTLFGPMGTHKIHGTESDSGGDVRLELGAAQASSELAVRADVEIRP